MCRSRKENLERAVEHEANGNSTAAYECYQKAVDISPQIARELIQVECNLIYQSWSDCCQGDDHNNRVIDCYKIHTYL